jgi:hypothetical protein
MQRIVEPAVYGANHPPVVLVALVGGDQPAVTPEELQAHLALKFRVLVGTAGVCAWLGGPFARDCLKEGGQVVHPEPELAVVRCLEVPSRDFDPMLVEVSVAAGAVATGASPLPAETLSPVHRTLDAAEVDPEIFSGDGLVALPSLLMTDMSASHTRALDSAAPACATVANVAAAPVTASVDDFISSISSNLSPPILSSPPQAAGVSGAGLQHRPR